MVNVKVGDRVRFPVEGVVRGVSRSTKVLDVELAVADGSWITNVDASTCEVVAPPPIAEPGLDVIAVHWLDTATGAWRTAHRTSTETVDHWTFGDTSYIMWGYIAQMINGARVTYSHA